MRAGYEHSSLKNFQNLSSSIPTTFDQPSSRHKYANKQNRVAESLGTAGPLQSICPTRRIDIIGHAVQSEWSIVYAHNEGRLEACSTVVLRSVPTSQSMALIGLSIMDVMYWTLL
jgi:hypothetical protein